MHLNALLVLTRGVKLHIHGVWYVQNAQKYHPNLKYYNFSNLWSRSIEEVCHCVK